MGNNPFTENYIQKEIYFIEVSICRLVGIENMKEQDDRISAVSIL